MLETTDGLGENLIADLVISSPNTADLSKNPRIFFYKKSGRAIDQERRWRSELERIRSRTKRNICFDSNRSCNDSCKEDTPLNQLPDKQSEKFTCGSWRSFSKSLMLAEWQLFRPPNFADQYIMKQSPKGRHVLVKTSKGCTNIFSRTGHIILRTKSRLPGGGLAQSDHHNASYSTILDCIMLRPDRPNSTDSGGKSTSLIRFGVLDLIRFRNTSYSSLSFRERCSWLEEYLAEQVEEYSDSDPVRFEIIPSVPCEEAVLRETLTQKPPFDLDGVLFYHMAVPYRPGPTPLVGWLKPFMLTEWFPEVQIHPDYCLETPPDYNEYKDAIRQQENEKMQPHVHPMSLE